MWRYATKQFDPTKHISSSDLLELQESLRLSASSFGLQPWKFITVTDKKLRTQLVQHAWNQSQVTDASHLIVLCARTDIDASYIKSFIAFTAKERKIPAESLAQYEQMMLGFAKNMSKEAMVAWAKNQVYIALGTLMTVAAYKRIDTCPMEGFDAKKFDEILGLEKEHLTSVVLCPVGYRHANDKYANLAKVRFAPKDVFLVK
jgi:nitroreductase